MGKSRFLQRLAAEARARAPRRWAVLLQALDHRNLLRDFPQPPDLTQEHLVELLAAAAGVASASSSVASARSFLEAALVDSGDIAVFIDGVDEICPSYKDKLISLVKMLLKTKVQLVWISSRPEVELALSEALCCPTATLRPFSKAEQKVFLCRHWSSACNRSPAEFEGLAAEMVAALRGAAERGQRSLLDVPLHAQMAAEAYESQAAQALATGGSLLPQGGVTLYQLYRSFVDKKRELYKTRFGLTDAAFDNLPISENFDEFHQNCAMLVLASDRMFRIYDWAPFRDFIYENQNNLNKEKTGILWFGESEILLPHFLHYTFIEYFAASWLVSQLSDPRRTSETAKDLWLLLLNRDVGVGVARILDQMLADGHPLHVAVLEGSEAALATALEAASDPNESDRFGRSALHQAAALGRADAVGALLAQGCDPGRRDALLGWTALRYASHCGHLRAAERLLQGGADPADLVVNDIEDAVLQAAEFGFAEIMDIIRKKRKSKNMKTVRNDNGQTPLIIATDNGQTKIVEILVKYGERLIKADKGKNQPIHYAASKGYYKITKFLLESNAKPNVQDEMGFTPLMRAAQSDDVQCLQLLLEHGADVNKRTMLHWTALHYAVENSSHPIIKLLLVSNANPNAKDIWGDSPLIKSTVIGSAESVQLLIEHGANVNQCDADKNTALHYAITYNDHPITKILLASRANPNAKNKNGDTPLMKAAEEGYAQSAQLLLEHGADMDQCNTSNWTALHYAIMNGNHPVTMLLLQNNANLNLKDEWGFYPLMRAAEKGDTQSVQLLLEYGADVDQCNTSNWTALHYAIENSKYAITKLLLESKANPNFEDEKGVTPLMRAAEKGDAQSVQLITEHGADVNHRNMFNRTALHYIILYGNHQITQFLLVSRANPNAKDNNGDTPLMRAVEKGDAQSAQLLLEHGADVDQCNTSNWTALHYAIENSNYAITVLLLVSNANPNVKDKKGVTPLMRAALKGDIQSVQLLLEHGADINQCDADNRTALHYAIMYGNHLITKPPFVNNDHTNDKGTDTPLMRATVIGNVQPVQILTEYGADVNQCNTDKKTSLNHATMYSNHPITKLLVSNANPNANDKNGVTPLMRAAEKGDAQSAQLLLEHGADVDQCNTSNWTALHYAIENGYNLITKLLLESNANPNDKDQKGVTPLMRAAKKGDWQSVQLLLESGADVNQCNAHGWTALNYASNRGHNEIVSLLRNFNGRELSKLQMFLNYLSRNIRFRRIDT